MKTTDTLKKLTAKRNLSDEALRMLIENGQYNTLIFDELIVNARKSTVRIFVFAGSAAGYGQ